MPKIYTPDNPRQLFDIFQTTIWLPNIGIVFFTGLITPKI
jgi:hypothetical protein